MLFFVWRRTKMLTQERLKELLHYEPETGIFTWRVRPNRRIRIGSKAGTEVLEHGNYRRVNIKVDGKLRKAHRLAWLYVTGAFPPDELDHIDRDATNNSIKNLRTCNHKENNENTSLRADNTSGHKGVSWCKKASKWVARIGHNGKGLFIGQFALFEDACVAYQAARDKLFTHHK